MPTFEHLVDTVKFATALADRAYADLGAADASDPKAARAAIEAAQCRLNHIDAVLRQVVGMMCPHCSQHMDRYDDGRDVTSSIALEDGLHYSRVWHPRPEHQINLPCNNLGTVALRDGTLKRVIVSAPGILDAVTVSEPSQPTDLGHRVMRWPDRNQPTS